MNIISKIRNIFSNSSNDVIQQWERQGKPVPPPHAYKQKVIKEYQRQFNYKTLIETGTFLGDMVEAQLNFFNRIISIELGDDLYKKAVERFKEKTHVKIIHGDSGNVLFELMNDINEPCIFWLDGHYSGGITAKGEKECPIFAELDAIFEYKKLDHILLIDDARLFTGEGDYPTINSLEQYIRRKSSNNYKLSVENDIIRCKMVNT
jgi:hypothetical protein